MKLLFLAVILTLSLCKRAEAQIDSNVLLSIPSFCSSCTLSVIESYNNVNTHQITSDTISRSESLCAQFLGSFPFQNGASTSFDNRTEFEELHFGTFTADTVSKLVNSIEYSHIFNSYFNQNAVLEIRMTVRFDSLPLSDSNGVLQIRGSFPCHFDFYSGVSTLSNTKGYSANGSCEKTGDTVWPLTLQIARTSKQHSAVLSNKTDTLQISITGSRTQRIVCTLPRRSAPLIIYDDLGRQVGSFFDIASRTEVSLHSLPPGCYFARLGDQIAKFVILE